MTLADLLPPFTFLHLNDTDLARKWAIHVSKQSSHAIPIAFERPLEEAANCIVPPSLQTFATAAILATIDDRLFDPIFDSWLGEMALYTHMPSSRITKAKMELPPWKLIYYDANSERVEAYRRYLPRNMHIHIIDNNDVATVEGLDAKVVAALSDHNSPTASDEQRGIS